MSIVQKLTEWQHANLLTSDQVQAIRAYEDAQPSATRFLWRYGLLGLGILIIGIGLLAIAAANWNAIPDSVKLSVHTLLNIGTAGTLFYYWQKGQAAQWGFEALLFIKAALLLTLMALLGQILHTQSPMEQSMLLWWCLITPMFLLFGRYRLTFMPWLILTVYVLFGNLGIDDHRFAFLSTLIAFTQLLILLPQFPVWHNNKPAWSTYGRKTGLFFFIAMTNVMLIAPLGYWHAARYLDSDYMYFYNHATTARDYLHIFSWEIALGLNIALAYALAAWRLRILSPLRLMMESPSDTRIVFAHLLIALLLAFIPAWFGWFLIYWFGVGYIGLRHDNRRIVSLAITALAVRIIVLYFEITHGLMSTGVLMIISGVLVLYLVKTYPRWRAAILSATGARS